MSKTSFSSEAKTIALTGAFLIGAAFAAVATGNAFLAGVLGTLGIVALICTIGQIADNVVDAISKKQKKSKKKQNVLGTHFCRFN